MVTVMTLSSYSSDRKGQGGWDPVLPVSCKSLFDELQFVDELQKGHSRKIHIVYDRSRKWSYTLMS